MATFHPKTWNELTERLYADSWRPALARFRSPFAFRGMQHADAKLSTTLSRLGGRFERQEGHLLRNFRKYAHRDAVPGDSVWNWLSLAKHHGLPTRLLDWTFSPFVALHFATYDIQQYGRDALVWCIDYVAAHKLLPSRLRKLLREEQADVFTAEMLQRVADSLPALDHLATKTPFLLFLEPPSLDDRIVNQFALFSLISSPTLQMDDWLKRHRGLGHKIIIPARLKWEIRDKLDQANISERVLFPGLDGLSRFLTRYYSPRPTSHAGAKRSAARLSSPKSAPDAADDDPIDFLTRESPSSSHAGNGRPSAASASRKPNRRSTRRARTARDT